MKEKQMEFDFMELDYHQEGTQEHEDVECPYCKELFCPECHEMTCPYCGMEGFR